MRIGLIGDTHGYIPALETAIRGCREAGADLLIHCGDFLSSPFSPDPPDETIALLRAQGVAAVCGNGEVFLRDWGTPSWEATLAQRLRRPDPPNFLPDIPAGQAMLSAESLRWLHSLPEELSLDCARPGDVYVCHAMPGNPFFTIWDADAQYTPAFTREEIEGALNRPALAQADLILCGHVPYPLAQRTRLTNGRTALVVRGTGFLQSGEEWWIDYWIIENTGPASLGFRAWEMQRHVKTFRPR